MLGLSGLYVWTSHALMPLIGQITSLAASIPVHFTVHSITCMSNYSLVLLFGIVRHDCVCVFKGHMCVQLLIGDHILFSDVPFQTVTFLNELHWVPEEVETDTI